MPVKLRAAQSVGIFGKNSSYQLPGLVEVDLSNQNLAGAQSNVYALLGIPPFARTNPLISSEDGAYTDVTTATVASRITGGGQNQFGTLGQVFLFQRASDGTLYLPAAGTTVRLSVVSAAAAAQVQTNLTAAYDLSTSTAFWTAVPLTVPTERKINPTGGTAVVNACQLFPGDQLLATLTSVGALNVTGNQLVLAAEVW